MSRAIFISPRSFSVGTNPNNKVGLIFELAPEPAVLSEGFRLGIELTPDEARHLAQTLQRMAASAEEEPPQGFQGSPLIPGPDTKQ